MSYILDALRRAELERARERGEVPGLNAQPEPASLGEASPRVAPAWRWGAGIGGVVLVLGAFGWWGLRGSGPAKPAAAGAAPATAAAQVAPAQAQPAPPAAVTAGVAPVVAPAPGPTLLVAPPAPPALPAPPAPPAAVPANPSPVMPTATPAATPAAAQTARPNPPDSAPRGALPNRAAETRAATASAAAAAASAAAQPVIPLASLSAAQRAELPPMAIGGAIYSEQAASRFIVINGSVIREGENAAPGVVLERIAPKSATLRWRDLRIEVPI
jgi:general secretion pathway protein B